MPGLQQINNISLTNITSIIENMTSPEQFFINVNTMIYGGWLYFILLSIIFVIIYVGLLKSNENGLSSAIYASTACTILSFLLRAVYYTQGGLTYALISDYQLWIFPISAVILALIKWSVQE